MLYHTKGIVLSTIKYSDTSIIVKLFTEKFGTVSYIINGVRSKKSKQKAGLFQPLSILDLESYYRKEKNLQRLKEYKQAYLFKSILFDIKKATIALFLTEILQKALKEEEPNRPLFQFIERAIIRLDESEKLHTVFHLWFLLSLSKYLGFQPHGSYSDSTPVFNIQDGVFTAQVDGITDNIAYPFSSYLSQLVNNEVPEKTTKDERAQLLDYILAFYRYHLEGFGKINSIRILKEVLS